MSETPVPSRAAEQLLVVTATAEAEARAADQAEEEVPTAAVEVAVTAEEEAVRPPHQVLHAARDEAQVVRGTTGSPYAPVSVCEVDLSGEAQPGDTLIVQGTFQSDKRAFAHNVMIGHYLQLGGQRLHAASTENTSVTMQYSFRHLCVAHQYTNTSTAAPAVVQLCVYAASSAKAPEVVVHYASLAVVVLRPSPRVNFQVLKAGPELCATLPVTNGSGGEYNTLLQLPLAGPPWQALDLCLLQAQYEVSTDATLFNQTCNVYQTLGVGDGFDVNTAGYVSPNMHHAHRCLATAVQLSSDVPPAAAKLKVIAKSSASQNAASEKLKVETGYGHLTGVAINFAEPPTRQLLWRAVTTETQVVTFQPTLVNAERRCVLALSLTSAVPGDLVYVAAQLRLTLQGPFSLNGVNVYQYLTWDGGYVAPCRPAGETFDSAARERGRTLSGAFVVPHGAVTPITIKLWMYAAGAADGRHLELLPSSLTAAVIPA